MAGIRINKITCFSPFAVLHPGEVIERTITENGVEIAAGFKMVNDGTDLGYETYKRIY
jgi:hypothetical protein